LALVLTGFCAVGALMMPATATAQDMRKGDSVEIRSDETVKGDLFVFAHRARIDGKVEGDVYLFSQDASVGGHVTGDVIAFAQILRVGGTVDGNVRSFTNTISLSGNVARNVLTFDDIVNLDSSSKIGGSLTAAAHSLNLDGGVGRSVLLFAQQTTLSGTVEGGVSAKGDSLRINSSAKVGGPIKFEGKYPPDVASDAKLVSAPVFTKLEHKPEYAEGSYFVWQVIWLAAYVLFGLVLFQLMPLFSREAVDSVEHYGASFGLGVLVFFGVPIAALIACVTVVGLFVGLGTLFIWYGGLYYAQTVVGTLVGQWLLGRTRETWPLIGRMVVGIVIVRLATMIPHAGGWIKFGVTVWGAGAISLALYRRFQPPMATGMAPAMTPAAMGGAVPA
jgi:cytoskeletal protein CcmA (bactofilin family)